MTEQYELLDRQGYTSTVYRLVSEDPPRLCKAFDASFERNQVLYSIEKAVYESFNAHDHPDSILEYYGAHDRIQNGLVLEYAEKRDLWAYLWDQERQGHAPPNDTMLYRWAIQAAEALGFAHSLHIFNSDIHPINFFLTSDLHLKVGDWAGASIHGGTTYSSYRMRYRLFDREGNDVVRTEGVSAKTEIFAFGSSLYFMITGHKPWMTVPLDDDEEIKRRITDRRFPELTELHILAEVVRRCWLVEFSSMDEVKQAIMSEEQSHK